MPYLVGNIHEDGARVILGPVVVDRIIGGMSAEQVVADLEPTALTILEDIANMFFPGAGAVIALLAYIISKSRPMTQEETNAWMDRTTQNEGNS
jgi:hypothetical protein